jgi:cytochrome c peroxidase
MNARIGVAVISLVAGVSVWAQAPRVTLSSAALREIADVEAEIDRIEAQTLERLIAPPDNEVQQVELLGKAMLYDKNLSVNRDEACAFCHMPETGFTGPVSELNRTTGSYPGSVRTRFSNRKPQSHAYAPLSPVLHYNPGQGDLVGGNFWDMRATGRRRSISDSTSAISFRAADESVTRGAWAHTETPATRLMTATPILAFIRRVPSLKHAAGLQNR